MISNQILFLKFKRGYYRNLMDWRSICFLDLFSDPVSAWHDISMDKLKMKKLLSLLLVLAVIFLNSCAVVGGIFKAGVWVGILIVVFIIGIIIWLVTRSGKS